VRPWRRKPRTGKRHWLRWVSVGVVVVVAGGALGAYLKYRAIDDSIQRDPLTGLGHRPPQFSTSSENILVYGSDSRAGLTPHQQNVLHAGHVQSDNTDTIMLVHISPGHHQVTVMSIPRDMMVPMYQCDSGPGYPGQQQNLSQNVQINSLLQIGGPSCLFHTVEQQTGIFINHFIGLGLVGFVKVINDVGGVDVCVPYAISNPVSGLNLKAGREHVSGVQALAFWRTREDTGNGSDLERIQRDQFLSAQIVKAVLGGDLLGNPLRLYHVVSDAAAALTVDSGMSISDLVGIAESFRGLNGKNVQFLTAPNQVYQFDANRVQLAQPQADQVFSAIAHDVTVPKVKVPAGTPSGGAQVLTVSPSKVRLEVLNGSGAFDAAGSAAAALTARGFDVTGTGNAPNFSYTASVIEYASAADKPAVNTLKKQLTSATVRQVPTLTPGTIQLIIGSEYNGLASGASPSSSPSPTTSPTTSATSASASPGVSASGSASPSPSVSPSGISGLAQSNGGITADASCASDANAFAG
jgi:LCP family protein required for cell wall assembly